MTAGSEFSRLPLREQYRRLELLRDIAIRLLSGDGDVMAELTQETETAGADGDGAQVAEDVARWLEAQE